VTPQQAEIRIATLKLLPELLPNLCGLHTSEPLFSRAESHDRELIILTGFQLQGSAGNTIRKDAIGELRQGERLMYPSRVARAKVLDDLLNQTF
jgi:hypothetical protein